MPRAVRHKHTTFWPVALHSRYGQAAAVSCRNARAEHQARRTSSAIAAVSGVNALPLDANESAFALLSAHQSTKANRRSACTRQSADSAEVGVAERLHSPARLDAPMAGVHHVVLPSRGIQTPRLPRRPRSQQRRSAGRQSSAGLQSDVWSYAASGSTYCPEMHSIFS
jgi:hypothetical protein